MTGIVLLNKAMTALSSKVHRLCGRYLAFWGALSEDWPLLSSVPRASYSKTSTDKHDMNRSISPCFLILFFLVSKVVCFTSLSHKWIVDDYFGAAAGRYTAVAYLLHEQPRGVEMGNR